MVLGGTDAYLFALVVMFTPPELIVDGTLRLPRAGQASVAVLGLCLLPETPWEPHVLLGAPRLFLGVWLSEFYFGT